jgi:hypothetical protein
MANRLFSQTLIASADRGQVHWQVPRLRSGAESAGNLGAPPAPRAGADTFRYLALGLRTMTLRPGRCARVAALLRLHRLGAMTSRWILAPRWYLAVPTTAPPMRAPLFLVRAGRVLPAHAARENRASRAGLDVTVTSQRGCWACGRAASKGSADGTRPTPRPATHCRRPWLPSSQRRNPNEHVVAFMTTPASCSRKARARMVRTPLTLLRTPVGIFVTGCVGETGADRNEGNTRYAC